MLCALGLIGVVAKEKGQCSLVFAKVANDEPLLLFKKQIFCIIISFISVCIHCLCSCIMNILTIMKWEVLLRVSINTKVILYDRS